MKFNLFAKKSLGQHFLNSSHVLSQIIEAAHLHQGELVLEIGPGTGVLTRALLDTGVRVIAVEKDSRAIVGLHEKFKAEIDSGKLNIIEGDVLEMNVNTIQLLNVQFSIVANIPYYITGAILEKFLEHGPRPDKMILLVQKEVAERIISRDGKESILSISVKSFGTPRIVARVSRGAFTPPPTVDSAILSIENISDIRFTDKAGKNVDIQRFFRIVHAGFAHKRKVVIRNLEDISDRETIMRAWNELHLDPHIRAENISVDQWIAIARCV